MKSRFLLLTAALTLVLTACGSKAPAEVTTTPAVTEASTAPTQAGGYQRITPEEAKALIVDPNSGIALVDVRTAEEYNEQHIPTAVNLAVEDIGDTRPEILPDLDQTILVYCRSGRRSQEAAERLLSLGYTDVRDLGGIQSWPYATISGSQPGQWEEHNGILSGFSTTDVEGNALNSTMLKDYKLNMVNVWATYCGPCLREMPELGELAAEYESQGVQIIGLVSDVLNSDLTLSDSQLALAQDIVTSTGADYPHIVPSEDLFGLLYQITSVPTTFFVDENGNLVGDVYVGSRDKAAWAAIIDATLSEVQ